MTHAPGGGGRQIYRPVSATVVMIASAAVAALLLVDVFLRGSIEQGLLIAPWLLLGLWAVYVLWFAPCIQTDAEGLRLHNVLNVVRIPWGQVAGIRLRWQVEVTLLDGRVVRAYGGPSQGRPRLRRTVPATDSASAPAARSDADIASLPANIRDITLIHREWERAQERGADAAPVRRTPDVPAIVALAILVAWAAASVLFVTSAG